MTTDRDRTAKLLKTACRWRDAFLTIMLAAVVAAVVAIFVEPSMIVGFLFAGSPAVIGGLMASSAVVKCESRLKYLDRLNQTGRNP